ncbi:MAG: hypothetical protein NZ954_03625 [Thermofilaceae archaeon]|nr:hypothetical protein [Thermofilaceae archaeon]MCX8181362.1 hypothetical protein [Thermofilaceae archaeon]MDW8004678.1 hypothetical protein [Thermofilaceae archaeon]
MTERKPFLANGSVVGNYEPLYRYWEKARGKGLEEVSISAEELEEIEERVKRIGRLSLIELRNELARKLIARVNAEVAEEAYQSLGIQLSREEAQKKIAEILAGWALEAAKNLGIVEFKGWIPKPT